MLRQRSSLKPRATDRKAMNSFYNPWARARGVRRRRMSAAIDSSSSMQRLQGASTCLSLSSSSKFFKSTPCLSQRWSSTCAPVELAKEKEEVAHRMKEKEELWLREKSVLETVGVGCGGERQKWKKIQHDNYNRSLDTRSYTFKTQDKKAMGAKVFVDGIRVATAELA